VADEFDNVPDGALVATIAAELSRGGEDAVIAFLKKHPNAGLRLIALLAPEKVRKAAEEWLINQGLTDSEFLAAADKIIRKRTN
jgi:hypothetical protein